MMEFDEAISTCMGKYATFSGRASRSEFWWFYLFISLMVFGAGIIGVVLSAVGGAILPVIVELGFLLPWFAVGSRRLHDIGKSGWWQLLLLTIVGVILLVIWWATATKPEGARYNQR